MMGLTVFGNTLNRFCISFFALHLTQYASMNIPINLYRIDMGETKSPFHLKRSKLYRKQTIYL